MRTIFEETTINGMTPANRWQQGDRSPARCLSCNGCFMPGIKAGGIYCVVAAKEKEKKEADATVDNGNC